MSRTIKSIQVDGENLQYDYNGLANTPTVDSELSSTSENPVQNKIVDSSIAIKKYPASVDGYYYALMDSVKSPNTVVENAQLMASVALGCENTIGNYGEFVAGRKNSVTGAFASALGKSNTASGPTSFACGGGNTSSGNASTSIGNNNTSSNIASTSIGYGNTSSGEATTALGYNNIVSGNFATATGGNNVATGQASFANGTLNIASGNYSVAGGAYSTAIGISSVTNVGNWVCTICVTGDVGATTYTYTVIDTDVTYEQYCLFAGNKVTTSIDNKTHTALITAVDITNKTITFDKTLNDSAALSSQECDVNATIAKGNYTFAARGIAVGSSSWTVNRGGIAIGANSFVGGNINIANNTNEVAFGGYNKSNTGDKLSAFTLGGGSSESDRKNIFEITTDGSIYAPGMGDYDGTNPTEAKSVQEVINSKPDAVTYVADSSATPNVTLVLNQITELTSTAITVITVTMPAAPTTDKTKTQGAILRFYSPATTPTILFPSDIRWAGGITLVIEPDTYYEISAVYSIGGWNVAYQSFKTV
jgi:hypothetical protein